MTLRLSAFIALVFSLSLVARPDFSFADEVDGTWSGVCLPGLTSGSALPVATFKESDSSLHLHLPLSLNLNCRGTALIVDIESNYQESKELMAPSSDNEFDVVVNKVYATPQNFIAATSLNLIGFCGFKNWQSKKTKDIAGTECFGHQIPSAGTEVQNILVLEGGKLSLGEIPAEFGITDIEFIDGYTLTKE